MRTYNTATTNYLTARAGVIARHLVWITAKDRSTGVPQSIGIWNGDDDQVITVDAVARTYLAKGALLDLPPMTYQAGLFVRSYEIQTSPLAQPIIDAIRLYDARLAPIEIHRVLLDTSSRAIIDTPYRMFKGWIDDVAISTPSISGESICTLKCVTSARALTRTVTLKKSDDSQRRRSNDQFRRDAELSNAIDVFWGEERHKSTAMSSHKSVPVLKYFQKWVN